MVIAFASLHFHDFATAAKDRSSYHFSVLLRRTRGHLYPKPWVLGISRVCFSLMGTPSKRIERTLFDLSQNRSSPVGAAFNEIINPKRPLKSGVKARYRGRCELVVPSSAWHQSRWCARRSAHVLTWTLWKTLWGFPPFQQPPHLYRSLTRSGQPKTCEPPSRSHSATLFSPEPTRDFILLLLPSNHSILFWTLSQAGHPWGRRSGKYGKLSRAPSYRVAPKHNLLCIDPSCSGQPNARSTDARLLRGHNIHIEPRQTKPALNRSHGSRAGGRAASCVGGLLVTSAGLTGTGLGPEKILPPCSRCKVYDLLPFTIIKRTGRSRARFPLPRRTFLEAG